MSESGSEGPTDQTDSRTQSHLASGSKLLSLKLMIFTWRSAVRGLRRGGLEKAGLRLRVLQSPTCYGAARDALFVKLASDLCDLWPDSPVVTTTARLRYVVQ